jgi:hypothetical protein
MSEDFSSTAAEAFRAALEEVRRAMERSRFEGIDEVREPAAPVDWPGGGPPEAGLGDPKELGERAALLALAEAAWRRHVGALLDTHQVQAIMGVGTRQAVSDRARRGGLLMLPTAAGRVGYPAFQFGPGGQPYPAVPRVLELFAEVEAEPWTVASWFQSPQTLLDDATPAEWLGQGGSDDTLLEAARRTVARLAH